MKKNSPLFQAAANGHYTVVQILLATNANYDARIINEALTDTENVNIVRALLARGANPQHNSNSAIISAAQNGNEDMVRLLLDAGADAQARLNQPIREAIQQRSEAIVRILLAAGAKPPDAFLRMAAYVGNVAIFRMLLDAKLDPHTLDGQPIIGAAFAGHLEIVRMLLKAGVNPNVQKGTALCQAVTFGHAEIVQMLLNAGADPHLAITAIPNAAARGYDVIIRMLLDGMLNNAGERLLLKAIPPEHRGRFISAPKKKQRL
jgi:ankyrin repeat protein